MEPREKITPYEELIAHGSSFAIAKIIKQILEAKNNYTFKDGVFKLKKLFGNSENVTELVVDYLIKKLLLVVENLPGGQAKQDEILEILDITAQKRNTLLLKKLISRCIFSSMTSVEESDKVLSSLAHKCFLQRDFDLFIDTLINTADEHASQLNVFSFSPEFIKSMGEYALKLPINQSLSLMTLICKHLEKNHFKAVVKLIEGGFSEPCVSALLLSTIFLNIRLADYSIREETLSDAIALFHSINVLLKSEMTYTLDNPKQCTGSLLTIAFAIGELQQLLLLYSPLYAEREPVKPLNSEKAEDEVWDFSFFHTFATKEQWIQLAESTKESYAVGWAPLVLQKIRYLILFSGRHRYNQEKLLKKLMAYLIEHFDQCQSLWLANIKYLLPYMTPQQIGSIGKKMVESPEKWNAVLMDEDVTEKRPLQMSLICAVFGSIHDRAKKLQSEDDELLLTPNTQTVLQHFSIHVEMWISGVNRINKETTNALKQSSQHLRVALTLAAAEAEPKIQLDLTELLKPLDVLDYLPLEYLSGPVLSSTVMALLSLLLSCSQDSMKSKIWKMIVRLLDKEKNSFLFDYFPCADFMAWAISNMSHLPESNLIYSTLLDEIWKSPKLSKDGFSWIREVNLLGVHLPLVVLLMKKLVQRKQTTDKVFSTVRKTFLKRIDENLETQLTTVLEGSLCLLEIYIQRRSKKMAMAKKSIPEKSSVEEDVASKEDVPAQEDAPAKNGVAQPKLKIKMLLKSLPKMITVATKGLTSTDSSCEALCSEFLSFLVVNHTTFTKFITRDPRMKLWEAYRACRNPESWSGHLLFQIICRTSSKELLTMTNTMLLDLQAVTGKLMEANVEDQSVEVNVNRVSRFFHYLVSIDLSKHKDRSGVRLQAIQTALPLVQHLILSVSRNYRNDMDRLVRLVMPPMDIYLSLLKSTPVYAYPHDLTSALHVCLALPLDAQMSEGNFVSIFTVIYKTLHYLLTKHQEVAADRVPVLLQVYRRLMAVTCSRSNSRRPIPLSLTKEDEEMDHQESLENSDDPKDLNVMDDNDPAINLDPAGTKGNPVVVSEGVGFTESAALIDSANRLSRLASVINTQPLRYRRVAAYLIVDLLDEFKKQALFPNVKQELTTALHHLMDLLDQHAVRYLMAVLPSGTRELFRVEYEQFEKFYKYKGKA